MTTYSPCRVYRRLRDGSFLFQTEVTGAWERTPLPGSSSGQLGSSHCEHLQKRIIVFLYTVSLLPAHLKKIKIKQLPINMHSTLESILVFMYFLSQNLYTNILNLINNRMIWMLTNWYYLKNLCFFKIVI